MHPLLLTFIQSIIGQTKWRFLACTYLAHFALTWLLLSVCQEPLVRHFSDFLYFYVVSGSTIGFGDLSPTTSSGKLVFALFIAPTSILLFTVLLAKIGELYFAMRRTILSGDIAIHHRSNHVIVIGWLPNRTPKLIDLIHSEGKDVVIVSDEKDLEHPLVDTNTLYVNVASYIAEKELARLSLKTCASLVIDTGDDSKNYLTSVAIDHYLQHIDSKAHIVVYADDESVQSMLESASERIEVIFVHKEHLLSRSALFAGSSSCSEALLNPTISATQYTLQLPPSFCGMDFMALSHTLRQHFGVIAIGLSSKDDKLGRNIVINPSDTTPIHPGDYVHYIAHAPLSMNDNKIETLLCSAN